MNSSASYKKQTSAFYHHNNHHHHNHHQHNNNLNAEKKEKLLDEPKPLFMSSLSKSASSSTSSLSFSSIKSKNNNSSAKNNHHHSHNHHNHAHHASTTGVFKDANNNNTYAKTAGANPPSATASFMNRTNSNSSNNNNNYRNPNNSNANNFNSKPSSYRSNEKKFNANNSTQPPPPPQSQSQSQPSQQTVNNQSNPPPNQRYVSSNASYRAPYGSYASKAPLQQAASSASSSVSSQYNSSNYYQSNSNAHNTITNNNYNLKSSSNSNYSAGQKKRANELGKPVKSYDTASAKTSGKPAPNKPNAAAGTNNKENKPGGFSAYQGGGNKYHKSHGGDYHHSNGYQGGQHNGGSSNFAHHKGSHHGSVNGGGSGHHHSSTGGLGINLKRSKIIQEKFDRKYNLISYIVLRKIDNYLMDEKYYLNDQAIYQQVDELIERRDLDGLRKIFTSSYKYFRYQQSQRQLQQIRLTSENHVEEYAESADAASLRTSCSSGAGLLQPQPQQQQRKSKSHFKDLDSLNDGFSDTNENVCDEAAFRCTNFTNSYNCNLFVYTIRQCLEHRAKAREAAAGARSTRDSSGFDDEDHENEEEEDFYSGLIELLFMKQCRPANYFLVDGDFPRRNIMHYASRYNCDLIPQLIISSANGDHATSCEDLAGAGDEPTDAEEQPPSNADQLIGAYYKHACAQSYVNACYTPSEQETERDADEEDDEDSITENYADADDSSEETENEEIQDSSAKSAPTPAPTATSTGEKNGNQVVPNESEPLAQDEETKSTASASAANYLYKTKSYFVPKSKFTQSEFILFRLCMQTDYNGNTPIHIAAMNNSFDVLKYINPLYIRNSQLIYNEDGLNPFLLACRHASLPFLKLMVEKCSNTKSLAFGYVDPSLLASRDKVHGKNCLHYVCARGCGREAREICLYLINIAGQYDRCQAPSDHQQQQPARAFLKELIGNVSLLTGSIYHAAASNLTRLSTLWYLLTLYPNEGIYTAAQAPNQTLPASSNHIRNLSILNSLDFREFSVVDCLIESVMNMREMAPPDCISLAAFYGQLVLQQQAQTAASRRKQCISFTNRYGLEPASTSNRTGGRLPESPGTESNADHFENLLKKCLYKLLVDCQSCVFNLPRVKNKWQLLEVCKLLVFMSKFGGSRTYAASETTTTTPGNSSSSTSDENNNNVDSTNLSIQSYFMNDFVINAPRFESIHCKNFEAFCLNFLNTFIFFGDLLPPFLSSSSSSNSGGGKSPANTPLVNPTTTTTTANTLAAPTGPNLDTTPVQTRLSAKTSAKLSTSCEAPSASAESSSSSSESAPARHPEINQSDLYVLVEILKNLHELCYVVLNSGNYCYSLKFQQKIYSFLKSYINVLVNYLSRLESMVGGSAETATTNGGAPHQNFSSANLRAIVKTHKPPAFALCSSVSSPLLTAADRLAGAVSYETESSASSAASSSDSNDTGSSEVRFTLYSRMPSQPTGHSSNESEAETATAAAASPKQQTPSELSPEESSLLESFRSSIELYQAKSELMNHEKHPNSLKNLCRIAVNRLIICKKRPEINIDFKKAIDLEEASDWSLSAFSSKYRYFRLPKSYAQLVNFLTFDLIDDLYGMDHDISRFMSQK